MCAAILDLFEDTRVLAEPAGALAVAGLKQWVGGASGSDAPRTLVAIQSGANINFHRLRHISERAELGEQREAILAVTIPERPGQLPGARRPRSAIAASPSSTTDTPMRTIGPRLRRGRAEARHARATGPGVGAFGTGLRGGGPDGERARAAPRAAHGRRPCGGASQHERVLRFEFPERPGALRRFLDLMDPSWNLTLFHYRNHGAALGRVLAGIQVPPDVRRGLRSLPGRARLRVDRRVGQPGLPPVPALTHDGGGEAGLARSSRVRVDG